MLRLTWAVQLSAGTDAPPVQKNTIVYRRLVTRLQQTSYWSSNVKFERPAQIKHLTKKAGADRAYTVNKQDTVSTLENIHNPKLYTQYLKLGTPPAIMGLWTD